MASPLAQCMGALLGTGKGASERANRRDSSRAVDRTQKLIRLFVSSTFDDMREERNALQAAVFPRFRQRCTEAGWDFQVVDLRWGIRDEATDEHRTVQICMEEIERCRRLSPNFNFVLLLGDRYGYRPLPDTLSPDAFVALLNDLRADGSDEGDTLAAMLREWYPLERNAVPPVHVLRTLDDSNRSAFWDRVLPALGPALREAAARLLAKGLLPEATADGITRSVTEQEVLQGMLADPAAKVQTACYARSIQGWKAGGPASRRFVDMVPTTAAASSSAAGATRAAQWVVDDEAGRLRAVLRARVRAFISKSNYWSYDVAWREDGEGISADHIPAFCDQVEEFLDRRLSHEVAAMRKLDAAAEETWRHHAFARERAATFVGREAEVARLLEHSLSGHGAVVVRATSGSGKSSLLATVWSRLTTPARASSSRAGGLPAVVVRFCGSTRSSSSATPLALSVLNELRALGATAAEANKETDDVTADDLSVSAMRLLIAGALERARSAAPKRPVVIIVDALDQLIEFDSPAERPAALLEWLPAPLPPGVRVIASLLEKGREDAEPAATLLRRLAAPPGSGTGEGGEEEAVAAASVALGAMQPAELSAMVDGILAKRGRTLQPIQRSAVDNVVAGESNPMYVQLIAERACAWPAHLSPPALPNSLPEAAGALLEVLERLHGALLLRCALGALQVAAGGLTEAELLDTLTVEESLMKDVLQYHQPQPRHFPPIVWLRLRAALGTHLADCATAHGAGTGAGAGGATTLRLYHRQLREAAQARYLSGHSDRRNRATAIASSVAARLDPKGDRSFQGVVPPSHAGTADAGAVVGALRGASRQVETLLGALLDATDLERLDALVTDVDVLEATLGSAHLGYGFVARLAFQALQVASKSPAVSGGEVGVLRMPRLCALVLLCRKPGAPMVSLPYVLPWEKIQDSGPVQATRARGTHCLHVDDQMTWKFFDKPFRDLSGARVIQLPKWRRPAHGHRPVHAANFGAKAATPPGAAPAGVLAQPGTQPKFGQDEDPLLPMFVRRMRQMQTFRSVEPLVGPSVLIRLFALM